MNFDRHVDWADKRGSEWDEDEEKGLHTKEEI